MHTKEREQKNHEEEMNILNMYWDGVAQDPVFHFEKLAKFSSIWMFHNNNRLAGDGFDWKAWIEHQKYDQPKKKRQILAN